jgi:outer membrane murein-binding lipoprotein Lpp
MTPNRTRTKVALAAVAALSALLLSGCTSGPGKTNTESSRRQLQAKKASGSTLEKTNLEEKRKREENPNAIGYVYLMNYGQIVGYYVTKGKISSSGSQATPTDQILYACDDGLSGCQAVTVDGPQDDGSYGSSDPGIFFFTTEGVKVVTSLDYIQSDQPLAVNAPKLNSAK